MVALLVSYQHGYAKLTKCSANGELKLRETVFSIHVPKYRNLRSDGQTVRRAKLDRKSCTDD